MFVCVFSLYRFHRLHRFPHDVRSGRRPRGHPEGPRAQQEEAGLGLSQGGAKRQSKYWTWENGFFFGFLKGFRLGSDRRRERLRGLRPHPELRRPPAALDRRPRRQQGALAEEARRRWLGLPQKMLYNFEHSLQNSRLDLNRRNFCNTLCGKLSRYYTLRHLKYRTNIKIKQGTEWIPYVADTGKRGKLPGKSTTHISFSVLSVWRRAVEAKKPSKIRVCCCPSHQYNFFDVIVGEYSSCSLLEKKNRGVGGWVGISLVCS